ncbi:MAG TPA: PA2169 family four-helix-bundle protein [Bacteroidia bacterium]|nr:PA2169 family four-helix-bundle protein [Bacteroidia bacterium]
MKEEKTIEILNKLVEINNDRIEGYQTASKETEEQDLKRLFSRYIATSQKCKDELATEIRHLGGKPTEDTKNTGKFFRVWMDVKAAISNKDRHAILSSCETGEDAAVHTYTDTIKNDLSTLTPKLKSLINEQRISIKADHDSVKKLRDLATVKEKVHN